jgi:hypothetical protein
MVHFGLLLIVIGLVGATVQEKKGLKKTFITARVNFFTWIKTVVYLVHNLKSIQQTINHQNREIDEMRLLVNYLLRNTNRFIKRRWIRYLSYAEESGIWDTEIIKLHPREKMLHSLIKEIDTIERTPQEVVNLMEREIPNNSNDPHFIHTVPGEL